MKNFLDIVTKYQKLVLGLAIFCSLSAVSVITTEGQTELILHNYPVLMFLLVAFSLVLALIYIAIDKQRIKRLSAEIIDLSKKKDYNINSQLSDLTARQKVVYDLIIEGKTNKEIMAALFIEQSTLKSHINQIYKKLDVKSRNELKSRKISE